MIANGTENQAYLPYVTRARAVVASKGGVPPKIVLMREGKRVAQDATEALLEAGVTLDPDRELTVDDMLANPELKATLGELSKAIEEGRLSYAQVGGFSEQELEGAYIVACKYLEMGQVLEAIRIAGYLIFLNPADTHFFQLVGIALQRLKMYESAEHFYKLAVAINEQDPMTWVYRGETQLMLGETDKGLAYVRKGLEQAGEATEHRDIASRAKVLLKQFGAKEAG